jgi:hypothetical protein
MLMIRAVQERVKAHYDYLSTIYDKDRILGIFAVGSMNYGTWREGVSDVDTVAIIVPAFEELCRDARGISTQKDYEQEHITIKDIRCFCNNLLKSSIETAQILFTEYKIINPMYEDLFNKYFIEPREEIASYDMTRMLRSVKGLSQSYMTQLDCPKKFYNLKRIHYFLQRYPYHFIQPNIITFSSCIRPQGETEKLWNQMKYGEIELTVEQQNKIVEEVNAEIEVVDNLKYCVVQEVADKLQEGVTEIIALSCKQSPYFKENKAISKEDFFSSLTLMEIKAYEAVSASIGTEGYVTVSKLVSQTSISRPVFNNLFNKMKQAEVAKIENAGVKGTYIKLYIKEN